MNARSITYRSFTRFLAALTFVAGIWPFIHHACLAKEGATPSIEQCVEVKTHAPKDEGTAHHHSNSTSSHNSDSCVQGSCCISQAKLTDTSMLLRVKAPLNGDFFDLFAASTEPHLPNLEAKVKHSSLFDLRHAARSYIPLHVLYRQFLN